MWGKAVGARCMLTEKAIVCGLTCAYTQNFPCSQGVYWTSCACAWGQVQGRMGNMPRPWGWMHKAEGCLVVWPWVV